MLHGRVEMLMDSEHVGVSAGAACVSHSSITLLFYAFRLEWAGPLSLFPCLSGSSGGSLLEGDIEV